MNWILGLYDSYLLWRMAKMMEEILNERMGIKYIY